MKALVRILNSTNYCYDSWVSGLKKHGYQIVHQLNQPSSDDVLVIWNRSARDEQLAKKFESVGAKVYVAENGYLGKIWKDHKWFALSLYHHNGAGKWCNRDIGGQRIKQYDFTLEPYNNNGTEIVFLPQRGIGEPGVAMPTNWKPSGVNYRTRPHPGTSSVIALEQDIANCKGVITWGSGAAIKAMAQGIPVVYHFENWIARHGATHTSKVNWNVPIPERDRLAAFENVFAAMWTNEEVAHGLPFEVLK